MDQQSSTVRAEEALRSAGGVILSAAHHIDFRQLRVVVVHPRGSDGMLLYQHLQRLGCQVEMQWPPGERCEPSTDLLFCLVDRQTRGLIGTASASAHTAVVGIVASDSNEMLGLLDAAGPQAVLGKPFDREGILTNIVVARSNKSFQRRLQSKVSRLEETLRSVRKVERAKAILMDRRKIEESEAYAYLRDQAMKKRLPIGVIASVIIDSSEVLSGTDEKD